MPDGPAESSPYTPAPPRCVLWHDGGEAVPAELVRSLEKRGVRITVCTDPYSAMARLCLWERSRREGAREGRAADGPFFLILVSPRSLPEAADVVHAAERYAPHAAAWLYETSNAGGAGANKRLRRIVPEDVRSWSGHDGAAPAAVSGVPGRPPLRLAGVEDDEASPAEPIAAPTRGPGPVADRSTPTEPEEQSRVHPILTNEELAMLLADDVRAAAPAAPALRPRPRRPGGGV